MIKRRQLRRKTRNVISGLEALEIRSLLAAAIPGVTMDTDLIPKFQNELPAQPLAPGSDQVFSPTGTTNVTTADGHSQTAPLYTVGAYEIQQDLGLGLIDPVTNQPVKTTVYGYGTSAATASFPGRTIVTQTDSPIAVNWVDGLTSNTHLLPVDPTVMDPMDEGTLYTVTPQTIANTPVTGTTEGNLVTFPFGIPQVVHLHGGHTQAAYDGTPMQWATPSGDLSGIDYPGTTQFTYDNTQQSATLWYHDHTMGLTRLNVYAGLAGFYIIHDDVESSLIANNNLPDERYDVPLVIQDRMFTEDGQLYYPSQVLDGTTAAYPSVHPEFFGDTILVNGQAWPVMNVEPRVYRFRLLNGSNSRFYNLSLNETITATDSPFHQIATDDGLMQAPVELSSLGIAPGERAEIVIDFSQFAGQEFILKNDANSPFPDGDPIDPASTGQIMKFRVSLPKSNVPDTVLPATLNTITPLQPTSTPRDLALFEGMDQHGRLSMALGSPSTGGVPFMESADTVQLIRNPDGTQTAIETWNIYNNTVDTHPIHLHQTAFQVVSHQAFTADVDPVTSVMTNIQLIGVPADPSASEAGWKDTIQVSPGTVTTLVAKFDLPGDYIWHCHILEHEEYDMMHWLHINPAPQTTVSLQEGVNGYTGMIDTSIKSDFPTATSGASATTIVAFDKPDRGSLLQWDLNSVRAGNIVESASITLNVTNPTKRTYTLYEVLKGWAEGKATWNQAAAGTPWGIAGAQQIGVDRQNTALAAVTSPTTGLITIPLNAAGIALVQKWIDSPLTNHGLTLQNYASSSGDGFAFSSSEELNPALRPKLTITYTSNPPTAYNDSYIVHGNSTLYANDANGSVAGINNDGVLLNDTDPENNPLTAVLLAAPTHASAFHLNPDGTFFYMHNGDNATSDSFTYRAFDGTNVSNVAKVMIDIQPTATIVLQEGVNGYTGMIDTSIKSDFPTATTGAAATTIVAFDKPDRGSLLQWPLPTIPAGNVVHSASITLNITNPTKRTYALYEVLKGWTEGKATWNQAAAGTPWGQAGAQQIGVDRQNTTLATVTSPANGLITIPLNADGLALVQKWIDSPSTNHGLTIQNYASSSGDGLAFSSSEAPNAALRPKLTITYGPGAALMAVSTPAANSASSGTVLTQSALDRLVNAAAYRWLAATPTEMQGAVLDAVKSISFAVADLPGKKLAVSSGRTVLIDRNAAGFGWFVDQSPGNDSEFNALQKAVRSSAAFGHMDLLSVVAHEMGHVLGYDHNSSLNVMHATLRAGQRTLTKADFPAGHVSIEGIDTFFESLGSPLKEWKLSLFS